jgi:hypothetical protein
MVGKINRPGKPVRPQPATFSTRFFVPRHQERWSRRQ